MPTSVHTQPVQEIVQPSSRRIVYTTLLTAMLIMFLLNTIAGLVLERFSDNRGYALIQKKWELLFDLKESVDILILGDSSCNQGVDPDLFLSREGKKALNLCTIGDLLALNDYWMLDYYVNRFGPPDSVILVHVYDMWHRGLSPALLAQLPLDWNFWKRYYTPLDLSWKQIAKFVVGRYVPLFAENWALSRMIMYPWRVKPIELSLKSTSGFSATEKPDPEGVVNDTLRHVRFVSKHKFAPSKENQAALKNLVGLASRHGFNLYLANSPMYIELFNDPRLRAYLDEVNHFLGQVAKRNKNICHLFAQPVTFSSFEMENADHLTFLAAESYTQRILDEMKACSKVSP